jgi:hypothetical protein
MPVVWFPTFHPYNTCGPVLTEVTEFELLALNANTLQVWAVLRIVPTVPEEALTVVGEDERVTVPEDKDVGDESVTMPEESATIPLVTLTTRPAEEVTPAPAPEKFVRLTAVDPAPAPATMVTWRPPDDVTTAGADDVPTSEKNGVLERVTIQLDSAVALESVITPEDTFTVGAELRVTVPEERLRTVPA